MSPKTIKISEHGSTHLLMIGDEAARKASEALKAFLEKQDQTSRLDPAVADEISSLAKKLEPEPEPRGRRV